MPYEFTRKDQLGNWLFLDQNRTAMYINWSTTNSTTFSLDYTFISWKREQEASRLIRPPVQLISWKGFHHCLVGVLVLKPPGPKEEDLLVWKTPKAESLIPACPLITSPAPRKQTRLGRVVMSVKPNINKPGEIIHIIIW